MQQHLFDIRHLEYVRPGEMGRPIAVLLHDCTNDCLYVRFTAAWEWCDDVEAEVMSALPEDIRTKADQMGASRLLAWMDSSLSNCLRISDAQAIMLPNDDIESELHRLAQRVFRGEGCTTHHEPDTMVDGVADGETGMWWRPDWAKVARAALLSKRDLIPVAASAISVLLVIQAGAGCIVWFRNQRLDQTRHTRTVPVSLATVPVDLPSRPLSLALYFPPVEYRTRYRQQTDATHRSQEVSSTRAQKRFTAPTEPPPSQVEAVVVPDPPTLTGRLSDASPIIALSPEPVAVDPPEPWAKRFAITLWKPIRSAARLLR